jgi:hypothetical protein
MNKHLAILTVSLVASLNLHAGPTPVLNINTTYNTGYAGSTPLAAGAADNDFIINGTLPPLVAFPIPGAWVTAAGAQWISPSEDQSYPPPPTQGDLPGDYTYETSFVNNFLVPTDVTISGSYAADNTATVLVDGNAIATGPTSPNSQFSFLTPFSITINVNPGDAITVAFAVTNYNSDNSDPAQGSDGLLNPTGLLVTNLRASAATPEPSTYAMLFAGLGALVLIGRMRRATAL